MPQHYTKNTLEVTHFCNTCRRNTQHYVWDGRLGPCKEDHHPVKPPKAKAAASAQGSLFEDKSL